MRYLRAEDARMRLGGSICRYKNSPVMVSADVNADMIANVYPLREFHTKKAFPVNLSTDPDLDVSSPPLGYINYNLKEGRVAYLSRKPERQQKQGMCESNTNAYFMTDTAPARWRVHDFSSSIADMIENKYPSVQDAMKYAFAGSSKAFHRRLAFIPGKTNEFISLAFSRTLVAFVFRNEGIAYLRPSFNTPFYKEILTRNGIKTESFHGIDFEHEAL